MTKLKLTLPDQLTQALIDSIALERIIQKKEKSTRKAPVNSKKLLSILTKYSHQ